MTNSMIVSAERQALQMKNAKLNHTSTEGKVPKNKKRIKDFLKMNTIAYVININSNAPNFQSIRRFLDFEVLGY